MGFDGIPLKNATLTVVTAPGEPVDYGAAATAGTARWTGSVQIYAADELVEVQSGERIDTYVRTRLELPFPPGDLVEPGDTLTYTYGATTHTRAATTVLRAPIVGRCQVHLEEE